MVVRQVLAEVPNHLMQQVQSGAAERVGMIVRDAASKKIIAHLQETAATQGVFGNLLSGGLGNAANVISQPISAFTGIGTIVQNEQIKSRLDTLTSVVDGLQVGQMATLVTSVAGIGVTAASTAIILSRLKTIETGLGDIQAEIRALREGQQDFDIRKVFASVRTSLERLQEVSGRSDVSAEIGRVEERLHQDFNQLNHGLEYVLERESISPEFVLQLLAAMAMSGSAQIKCLIWLDEHQRASDRSGNLFRTISNLSQRFPADDLKQKLATRSDDAPLLISQLSEVRMNFATVPSLAETLMVNQIRGQEYIERIESEKEKEMLFLMSQP